MEIKRSEILNLWYIFQHSKNDRLPKNYSYFVAKNKLAIEPMVIEFEKKQESSDKYKEYDEKRAKLAHTLADRQPETNLPLVQNGEYVIVKRKAEFDRLLAEMKQQHKEVVDERAKQIEVLNEFLREKVDVETTLIKYEDVPESIAPSVVETFIVTGLLNQ